METKLLDVYSEDSNYGIVRMPGRQFPGCVIQGDSLAILCRQAISIAARIGPSVDSELRDDLSDLVESLFDRLKHYEAVLKQHQMPPPYSPLNLDTGPSQAHERTPSPL